VLFGKAVNGKISESIGNYKISKKLALGRVNENAVHDNVCM